MLFSKTKTASHFGSNGFDFELTRQQENLSPKGLLNKIGCCYERMEEFEEAISVYREELALWEATLLEVFRGLQGSEEDEKLFRQQPWLAGTAANLQIRVAWCCWQFCGAASMERKCASASASNEGLRGVACGHVLGAQLELSVQLGDQAALRRAQEEIEKYLELAVIEEDEDDMKFGKLRIQAAVALANCFTATQQVEKAAAKHADLLMLAKQKGFSVVPHFVRIETKGLESFATIGIREFEVWLFLERALSLMRAPLLSLSQRARSHKCEALSYRHLGEHLLYRRVLKLHTLHTYIQGISSSWETPAGIQLWMGRVIWDASCILGSQKWGL